MESCQLESLQAAVRSVERRLRTVTVGWILTLTVCLVFGLWGQQALSQTSILRGRRLEITDETGQTRIALDAVGRRPSLWFYDTSGKRRLGLMVVPPEVPVIWLLDPEERSRVELSVLPDGANAIVLSDAQRRPRMLFHVNPDGTPSLSLLEALARPRILMKVLDNGVPGFWLFDTEGRIKFSPP